MTIERLDTGLASKAFHMRMRCCGLLSFFGVALGLRVIYAEPAYGLRVLALDATYCYLEHHA